MEGAIFRNGGPTRISHFIKRYPAVNIHHAVRYSERIGLALNRFVTINFSHTVCQPDRASSEFRRLLTQRFAPWLRRSAEVKASVPPTYVWAIESAGDQTAVHWLVYIPHGAYRAFDRRLSEWMSSLLGGEPEEQAVRIKSISNLTGLKRYILKGIDPAWASHLGVRHVDQGKIIGKRSGFSKNLGPSARHRGGYRPRKVPPRSKGFQETVL
jgi:hypothetical protein